MYCFKDALLGYVNNNVRVFRIFVHVIWITMSELKAKSAVKHTDARESFNVSSASRSIDTLSVGAFTVFQRGRNMH
jgi:hypothetical protein